jgi:hypothetical protein
MVQRAALELQVTEPAFSRDHLRLPFIVIKHSGPVATKGKVPAQPTVTIKLVFKTYWL